MARSGGDERGAADEQNGLMSGTRRADADHDTPPAPPRSGRRPGPTQTREAILASARELFAAKGYDGTTMRDIARAAQVNPALIHHFFGAKERVFVAALGLPFTPADLLPTLLAGPRQEFGERLVRTFLSIWGNQEHRVPLLALVRSATTNEQAAQTLRQFLGSTLLSGIADGLGVPRLRIAAAAGQLVGMALLRFVLRVEPLASASEQELVDLLGPVVQGYVDKPPADA